MNIKFITIEADDDNFLSNVETENAVISYTRFDGSLEALTIHLTPQTNSILEINALREEFQTNSSMGMALKFDPIDSAYSICYDVRDEVLTLLALPSCLSQIITKASDYAVYNTHIRDIIVYKGGLSLAVTLGFI